MIVNRATQFTATPWPALKLTTERRSDIVEFKNDHNAKRQTAQDEDLDFKPSGGEFKTNNAKCAHNTQQVFVTHPQLLARPQYGGAP